MSTNDKNHIENAGIDLLHIPHFNFSHWHANNEETAKKSIQDKSLREFGIRFFLEDLRAGTNWAYMTLTNNLSQSIECNSERFDIWFEKNESGYLKSVLITVDAIGCIEGFKKSTEHVFPILSTLCFFYRRAFRIKQVTVIDGKHNINFDTRQYCPPAKVLTSPRAAFKNSAIGSLFAIYRDGMNSIDLAYRYICFFKIYEAWYCHEENFFFRTKDKRPKILLTRDLLAGSYSKKYHNRFLNKNFDDKTVYDRLNHMRKYLVHPLIDKGLPASLYNLDQIDFIAELETMSNVIERIATKILDAELSIGAEYDEDIKAMLAFYRQ